MRLQERRRKAPRKGTLHDIRKRIELELLEDPPATSLVCWITNKQPQDIEGQMSARWDGALATAMANRRVAVHEEAAVEDLLQDLSTATRSYSH